MNERQEQLFSLMDAIVDCFKYNEQLKSYSNYDIVFSGDFNINMLDPSTTYKFNKKMTIYTTEGNKTSSYGDNNGNYNPTNIDFVISYSKDISPQNPIPQNPIPQNPCGTVHDGIKHASIIKDSLTDGNCFYSSIYRAAKEQKLNLINDMSETKFITDFRSKVADRFSEECQGHGGTCGVFETLNTDENTYKELTKNFPEWFKKEFPTKPNNVNVFKQKMIEGIKKDKNWVGQIEVEIAKKLLLKENIHLDICSAAIPKELVYETANYSVITLSNPNEQHYKYFGKGSEYTSCACSIQKTYEGICNATCGANCVFTDATPLRITDYIENRSKNPKNGSLTISGSLTIDGIEYTFERYGGGKSGAIVYILTPNSYGSSDKMLKIYTSVKSELKGLKGMLDTYTAVDNPEKLHRAMREIAVYCTFNKMNKTYIPKMQRYGKLDSIAFGDGDETKRIYSNMKDNPYIITDVAKGESLRNLLEKYNKGMTNAYRVKLYNIIQTMLIQLKELNENTKFSHEDFHPENIYVDETTLNVTFIDFDLAEFGDDNYENNLIPIKRPGSRDVTSCVPGVLNDTLKEIVGESVLGELRRKFNTICAFKNPKLDRVAVLYYLYIFTYLMDKDKFKTFFNDYKELFDKINDEKVTNVDFYIDAIVLVDTYLIMFSNNKADNYKISKRILDNLLSKYNKEYFDRFSKEYNTMSEDDRITYGKVNTKGFSEEPLVIHQISKTKKLVRSLIDKSSKMHNDHIKALIDHIIQIISKIDTIKNDEKIKQMIVNINAIKLLTFDNCLDKMYDYAGKCEPLFKTTCPTTNAGILNVRNIDYKYIAPCSEYIRSIRSSGGKHKTRKKPKKLKSHRATLFNKKIHHKENKNTT